MNNPANLIGADLNKWGERLAASDWTWSTWKWLLGDTALILLWMAFLMSFVMILIPSTRKQL